MCKTTYTFNGIRWGTTDFVKVYSFNCLHFTIRLFSAIFLVSSTSGHLYRINRRVITGTTLPTFIPPNGIFINNHPNRLWNNKNTQSFWDKLKNFLGCKDNSQSLNFCAEKPLDIPVPLLIAAQPPYDTLIQSSPSEIFSLFSENAPVRVKEAAMATVSALIGTLYKYAIEATFTITTESLNTLLNQLHMTGYMLCNAEYRLSLYEKLNNEAFKDLSNPEDLQSLEETIKLEKRDDLLTFIRQMSESQTNSLTENASLQAIQVLKSVAQVVVQGLAANSKQQSSLHLDLVNKNGGKQYLVPVSLPLITQNASSIKQLCLWHLALGYMVRQIEARHQIKESLEKQ